MAGAGWRDFIAGEVLTAANVQDYLQDQAVMAFASSAARGSAIASPTEGMVSYLRDSDVLEFYNGASWTRFAAGSGLPVANGGTGATTLAGAQAALGVSVLQAVSNTTDVEVITTSSTFVSGGLTATITPSSTSSKVLVLCSTGVSYNTRTNFGIVTLFRGTTSGTDLGDSGGFGLTVLYPSTAATSLTNFAATVLDSPGTISPQTYTLAIKTSGGGTINAQASGSKGSMVLLEVRG